METQIAPSTTVPAVLASALLSVALLVGGAHGCAAPTASAADDNDLLIPVGALAAPLIKAAVAVLALDAALSSRDAPRALQGLQGRECALARAAVQLELNQHNAENVALAQEGIDRLCQKWALNRVAQLEEFLGFGTHGFFRVTFVENFNGSQAMLGRYQRLQKATRGWKAAELITLVRAVAFLYLDKISKRASDYERGQLLAAMKDNPNGQGHLKALLDPDAPFSDNQSAAYSAVLEILDTKRGQRTRSEWDDPDLNEIINWAAIEEEIWNSTPWGRFANEDDERRKCQVWRAKPDETREAYFGLRRFERSEFERLHVGGPAKHVCKGLDPRGTCVPRKVIKEFTLCGCYELVGIQLYPFAQKKLKKALAEMMLDRFGPCADQRPDGEPQQLRDFRDAA